MQFKFSFQRRYRSKFSNYSHNSNRLLLPEEELRFAAECERMRVDRNGSILSILFITLSEEGDLALMERVLEGRLRLTDTPGMLNDGRIVLLLPDTPEEGAWKVAADISEVYPPGPHRPQCDVIVYPDVRTKRIKEVSDSSHSLGVAPSGTDAAPSFASHFPGGNAFWISLAALLA